MSGDIASIVGGEAQATDPENARTGDFEPMPAGWYPFSIDKVEIRDTNAKTGKYLWLELTVIGERYANRKVFPKITLQNPNAKAVEIGMRDLGDLALACGLQALADTQQVIGKQVDARLKIRPAEKGYEAQNEVTAWAVLGKQSGKAPAAKPARAAGPTNGGSSPVSKPAMATGSAPTKRPWEK